MKMNLSEYLDESERNWKKNEILKARNLLKYLERHIPVDLRKVAHSENELEILEKLHVWLFNFYQKEFLEGLKYINYDVLNYKKHLIYSFILSVLRNKSNIDILYDVLVSKEIIEKMLVYEDSNYEIITKDFGIISFKKASNIVDEETKKYLESLGNQIIDGCHEITFFHIQKNPNLKAVTSICTKWLDCKYYHSFALDCNNIVIDLTANLIMPQDMYYLLQDVEELNVVNYLDYLKEENSSREYDESNTLFPLLRCALYKQVLNDKNKL